MAEKENAQKMEEFWEIMVKDKKELWEILARDREEHREHLAQMMQVIMSAMTRETGTVDDIVSMDTTTLTQKVSISLGYLATDFAMLEARIPHWLVPPLSNAMPDPIQSIPNLWLDNLGGSQK